MLALAAALALAVSGSSGLAATGSTSGLEPLPNGFVGVNVDGPLFPIAAPGINLAVQFAKMEQSGVESVRLVFNWATAQPYESWSKVPAGDSSQYVDQGGVPTDFSQTDAVVRLAARFGLTVLPTVIYPPSWDSVGATPSSVGRPAVAGPYAAFLADLVRRYGPRGNFWRGNGAADPIREWQIWNEPDLPVYWPKQPFAASYVALLKAADRAVKLADPHAQVVLGGLANYSWRGLQSIYRIPGSRSTFDVVAVHPYTATPSGVITILGDVRAVMNRSGDSAKPMIADEIGWPSSLGHSTSGQVSWATTKTGQAHRIAALLPMLAAQRRALGLSAFYYYTWAGTPQPRGSTFSYAGLFDYLGGSLVGKPALGAFAHAALSIERCKRRSPLATRCAEPVR
jgi:hypothetical protein